MVWSHNRVTARRIETTAGIEVMASGTSQDHLSSRVPGKAHMHFLQSVREYEMNLALERFPPPEIQGRRCKVLEVGSGTGQQAKRMNEAGYDVMAIDLASSSYRDARVFHVVEYDGSSIPAADRAFDVVFSSNVLEHVTHIDAFLDEALRVMAIGGVAIHILPTPAARFWSIPAHYLWLTKRILSRVFTNRLKEGNSVPQSKLRKPANAQEWLGTFFPLRHGERGNTLTEMFYFSRWWWMKKFRSHGFSVTSVGTNHLFYTMANSMTDAMGLSVRRRLSTALGSACAIYVLQRT